ncbi:MAG: hypothetical protein ACYTGL_30595 [Planctomycetota bacterium]
MSISTKTEGRPRIDVYATGDVISSPVFREFLRYDALRLQQWVMSGVAAACWVEAAQFSTRR